VKVIGFIVKQAEVGDDKSLFSIVIRPDYFPVATII
jgi:hypothetical protein